MPREPKSFLFAQHGGIPIQGKENGKSDTDSVINFLATRLIGFPVVIIAAQKTNANFRHQNSP